MPGRTSSRSRPAPLENELTLVNNRAVVAIDGVRDKLRVLLVSGEPHAGERTWRNLLKSDASVDLVHFTILRPPEKQDGTPINELVADRVSDARTVPAEDQRIPPDHLRPLRPPGRAADRLFRQHRALCARRRRGAGRRRVPITRRPPASGARRWMRSCRRSPSASSRSRFTPASATPASAIR